MRSSVTNWFGAPRDEIEGLLTFRERAALPSPRAGKHASSSPERPCGRLNGVTFKDQRLNHKSSRGAVETMAAEL